MNSKQCDCEAGSTGQSNGNPESEVEHLETDGDVATQLPHNNDRRGRRNRRHRLPVHPRASRREPVSPLSSDCLRTDRETSRSSALISGMELSSRSKRSTRAGRLRAVCKDRAVRACLPRSHSKPPTQNIKEIVNRGGDETRDDTVWNEEDEYLIKSGENGVLGRQIELIAPDPQSDNTQFQSLSRRLILEDKVDVIMAGFASAEREAIRPIMDQNKMLYFYNNQYEGGVADKYTFCTGAIPEQQIVPVMQYMIKNFGPKIYTLAADYNFGQLSAAWTRAMAPILNAEVIGEEFIPLSVSQFSSSIARIQEAKPDWLMMYITGQNHSNYYPQAKPRGSRSQWDRVSTSRKATSIGASKPPALARFHVTASYMEEIPTPAQPNSLSSDGGRCFPMSRIWLWKDTAPMWRPTCTRRQCG